MTFSFLWFCLRARSCCVKLKKNCLPVAKRYTSRMRNNRVFSLLLNENFVVPYCSQTEKNYYSPGEGNRYFITQKSNYSPPHYAIIPSIRFLWLFTFSRWKRIVLQREFCTSYCKQTIDLRDHFLTPTPSLPPPPQKRKIMCHQWCIFYKLSIPFHLLRVWVIKKSLNFWQPLCLCDSTSRITCSDSDSFCLWNSSKKWMWGSLERCEF